MTRITAITAPFPGVTQWLRHGEKEGFWDLTVLDNEYNEVPGADVYLLGAWHPFYDSPLQGDDSPTLLDQLSDQGTVHVAWSSSPTESDIEKVETEFMRQINVDPRVDKVACLHPGLVPYFDDAYHLPAPVNLDPEPEPASDPSGVGLYNPAGLKKNVLTQVLAVKYLHEDSGHDAAWRLHTNMQDYANVLDRILGSYILEDWVPRDKHLQRLAERRACLCASHGESWSYAAIDAMMASTPVVATPTVPCVPDTWQVDDPNDPRDVQRVLNHVTTNVYDPRTWVERLAEQQHYDVEATLNQHVR